MKIIKGTLIPIIVILLSIYMIINIKTEKETIDISEMVVLERKLADYSFINKQTGIKHKRISHQYYLDFLDLDKKVQISASILEAFDERRFKEVIRKGDKLRLHFVKSEIDLPGEKIQIWGIAKGGIEFINVDNAIKVYTADTKTGLTVCYIIILICVIWIIYKKWKGKKVLPLTANHSP